VSMGGILKSADFQRGIDGERIAFAASMILASAEAAAENLGQGKLGQLAVDLDGHILIFRNADESNVLVIVAEHDGNAAPLSVEAERAVERIREIQGI
jgi:uncharacterized protein